MKKKALIRLTKTKNTRVLTWQGYLLIFLLCALSFYLFIRNIEDFLSPKNAVFPADIMVVEGFVHDYVIDSAMALFAKDGYKELITSGTYMDMGAYLSQYTSTAQMATATFLARGFPEEKIHTVPTKHTWQQRTYNSALSVRAFIDSSGRKPLGINIVSLGAHGRRSYFLFKKTFEGSGIPIGIISIDERRYDPKKWWESSKGARTISNEFLAWLYEWLFFSPKNSKEDATK